MEVVHMLLNVVLLPLGLGFLVVAAPMLAALRFAAWLLAALFPERVAGKVVVITGASSGIGEQAAYVYAKKHARLALAARREEQLAGIARRCRLMGAEDVLVVPTDVSKVDDCEKLINETVNYFGRLDHLFNNAGLSHSFFMEDAKNTEIAQIMDINFWGAVFPTFYALPHLRRSRGHIIVTSSVASFLPYPRMAVYNAAKAGLVNFFDTLRVEVGDEVKVTVATPGWAESEMTAGKFMTADASVEFDREQRDVHVGPFPVERARTVASAIVNGALRGQRYVRVPWWYSVLLLYRVFAPDVVEAFSRLFFTAPRGKAPVSRLLAQTGVPQKIVYPESIVRAGGTKEA